MGDTSMSHAPSGTLAPPPAVATAPTVPATLWQRFWDSMPAHIKTAPESVQKAFMRRLMMQYQEALAKKVTPTALPLVIVSEYRRHVATNYVPLHPHLREMREGHFDPQFLAIMTGKEPLEEVHPLVYKFRVFTMEYCMQLLEEVAHFEAWATRVGLHLNRPNSMNNYGAILDDFGFDALLQEFVIVFMRKLAPAFPDCGAETLDSHHGFLVDYEIGKDVELGFHVDDSEITLNVCLGREFTGGELYFRGRRCKTHQQTVATPAEDFAYLHEPGMGVVHIGRHRHGAKPITSGRRSNLILWARSSAFRARLNDESCASWCAALDPEGGRPSSTPVVLSSEAKSETAGSTATS